MIDRVTEYARKVVNHEIFTGELHRLACKRHLKDLERQYTPEFPYYWDIEKSERILQYAETLTIGEGFEKKPVQLLGFQIFDMGCLFGWYNQKAKRRFRRSYESMARQNSKTFKNGIRGTYIAGFSRLSIWKTIHSSNKKKTSTISLGRNVKIYTE